MRPSRQLIALIDASAPLWAGEAEVFRSYWDWSGRSPETDLKWLFHQTYKEFWDGFMVYLGQLRGKIDHLESGIDRAQLLDVAGVVEEELEHYCLFADVYEHFADLPAGSLDPMQIKREGGWPENSELGRVRREHRQRHSELGVRATLFTEGGYCTLYSEGMKLRGRNQIDNRIAAACAEVYNDEFEHMLRGIAGLDQIDLGDADWQLFTELTVEQLGHRIRMRNAQFSSPLPAERVETLCAGEAEPLRFDYRRAGFD